MLCRLNGKVEIRPKFGPYLQDLRLILKKRLLYLIGFAANTGNSSSLHTFNVVSTSTTVLIGNESSSVAYLSTT